MNKNLKKFREQFSSNVRARRAYLGLTQEDLAEKARLERTYISQIERNNANPTIDALHALAKALDTTASELLSGK
jgi:transcriptional regulator with XRE-family HTH domain